MIKETIIGFLITLAATLAGIFFWIMAVSEHDVVKTLEIAMEKEVLGNIIGLGALLNFLPFFVFLKKKQIYRVRGAVFATLLVVLVVLIIKL